MVITYLSKLNGVATTMPIVSLTLDTKTKQFICITEEGSELHIPENLFVQCN